MELQNEEKEMLVKALQFYINNVPYQELNIVQLRKLSDLKEKIKSEIE